MISVHLDKLRQRVDISPAEERAIRDTVSDVREVSADEVIVRSGRLLDVSLLLLKGWLVRCKDLAEGDRQISEIHVPGDFADMHAYTLKKLDHDVVALTPCRLAVAPHEKLHAMFDAHPRLERIYWFQTNVDAAIQRELVLSLGQRSALSRMAHLFCELYLRLEVVGKAADDMYEFPMTQRELSECLGLTVVHANRTLQELRRRGLVELENRRLRIRDRAGLEGVAEFDATYLYLDKQKL